MVIKIDQKKYLCKQIFIYRNKKKRKRGLLSNFKAFSSLSTKNITTHIVTIDINHPEVLLMKEVFTFDNFLQRLPRSKLRNVAYNYFENKEDTILNIKKALKEIRSFIDEEAKPFKPFPFQDEAGKKYTQKLAKKKLLSLDNNDGDIFYEETEEEAAACLDIVKEQKENLDNDPIKGEIESFLEA